MHFSRQKCPPDPSQRKTTESILKTDQSSKCFQVTMAARTLLKSRLPWKRSGEPGEKLLSFRAAAGALLDDVTGSLRRMDHIPMLCEQCAIRSIRLFHGSRDFSSALAAMVAILKS